MTAYVAPAARVLTVVHLSESTGPAYRWLSGETLCGIAMAEDECWVPVELRSADQVCKGCQGQPEDEQAVLL